MSISSRFFQAGDFSGLDSRNPAGFGTTSASPRLLLALLLCASGACGGVRRSGDGYFGAGGDGGDGDTSGGPAGMGGSAGSGGMSGAGGARSTGGTGGSAGRVADAAAPGDGSLASSADAQEENEPPWDSGPPPALPDGGVVSAPPPVLPADEPLPPCKRTVPVANTAALATAVTAVQAGDCIVLADGTYVFPAVTGKGTAAEPIVIRAANLLKATVTTGNLNIQSSSYVVVQGLTWTSGGGVVIKDSDHCRFSRSRMQRDDSVAGEWVSITGTSKYCRIDHNDFGPQNHVGNMIQLAGAGAQIVQYNRIDHNFFHDVHFCCSNGWEIVRAGLSGWTFSSAHNVIEFNLLLRTADDPEAISLKSSDNVLRYNTMRASAAMFSLRHGNRSLVYGNYIFGEGVVKSNGIRVCGGDHRIFNNYIENVDSYGIMLEGGESDATTGAITDHKQVYRTMVVFNTIVNTNAIDVGGGHPMKPLDCTIAYNITQGAGTLIRDVSGNTTNKFTGNISNGPSSVTNGVKVIDPKLVKVGEVFQIGSGSPAIDNATSVFTFVTDDIQGKMRMVPDIGAYEVSTDAPKYGPLTEADVGPMAP